MMKRMRNLFRSHEDTLARLTARRDDLARRLAEAEAAFDRITAERRRLLIEADDPDGPALERAERDWLAAHGRVAALQDAHREIAGRIAAAQDALAAERDKAARERSAADLRRKADAVDLAASELARAMEGVESAYTALVAAVRSGGLIEAPEVVAGAILIGGLERMMPGLLARVTLTGWTSEQVAAAARRLQSDPLRTLAEAIRNGEADPVTSEPVRAGGQPQSAP